MTLRPTAERSVVGQPVVPRYGSSTLGDLLPSIGAHLGVPGCAEDVLGLPAAQRYVVVLVDGLGFHLVRRALRTAPYFASLLGDAPSITSGVPSTTATSLASLGTGLPPGQHGIVGYASRVPQTGEILNALSWSPRVPPRTYQPRPTLFERAQAAGVAVTSVALKRFEATGLTEAALRGADFVGFADEQHEERRIELVVEAVHRGERSLVYAYERELDHTGHARGCQSERWLAHLARIDALRERYGHVLVAMRGSWAVMTSQFPRELQLVGMHGSLTPEEMVVPLCLD